MKEWQVWGDGVLWGEQFNTKNDAEDYIDGLVSSGHEGNFIIVEKIDNDKCV